VVACFARFRTPARRRRRQLRGLWQCGHSLGRATPSAGPGIAAAPARIVGEAAWQAAAAAAAAEATTIALGTGVNEGVLAFARLPPALLFCEKVLKGQGEENTEVAELQTSRRRARGLDDTAVLQSETDIH